MALIKCPECETEVSDKAEKCPKCAYPIAEHEEDNEPQVIEQTSKTLKSQVLYAICTVMIGFFFLFMGSADLAIIILVVGVVWLIIAKIRIWWHHE